MAEITKFKTRGTQSLNVSQALDTSGIASARAKNIEASGDLISNLSRGFAGLLEDNQKALYQENYSTFQKTVSEKQTALNIALGTADVSNQKKLVDGFNKEVDDLRNKMATDKDGGPLYERLIGGKLESLTTTAKNQAQLKAFDTVRKNTIDRVGSAQNIRAENYGSSPEDIGTWTGAVKEIKGFSNSLSPKDIQKLRVKESTNLMSGIAFKALGTSDKEAMKTAEKRLETWNKSSYIDEEGKTQNVSEFVDQDKYDRFILRLKQGQKTAGSANNATTLKLYNEIKQGIVNNFDPQQLDSMIEIVGPQLTAQGEHAKLRELEVLNTILPKYRSKIYGLSPEEQENVISLIANSGSMMVDGKKVFLDLTTFNVLAGSQSLLKDIAKQDQQLRQSDPHKYVNDNYPKLTVEQNMAYQKELGVKQRLPFSKEIYDNYVGSARRLGVNTVAEQLRKNHPNYMEDIANFIASDPNNKDIAHLSLALYAGSEATEGLAYYFDPIHIKEIEAGFTTTGTSPKELRDEIADNSDMKDFSKEFSNLEKQGLVNKMSALIEITAKRTMNGDKTKSASDAVKEATTHWLNTMFVKFDNNMDTGSGITPWGSTSTTIPRSAIGNSRTKLGQVTALVESIDQSTLTKWGFSADQTRSIIARGQVYYEGGKLKLKYDDGSFPKLKDGSTLEIDLETMNDPEKNPIYQDYIDVYTGKKQSFIRNNNLTIDKIEADRNEKMARAIADEDPQKVEEEDFDPFSAMRNKAQTQEEIAKGQTEFFRKQQKGN